ncbi:hypothetical protein Tco_0756746 [Tanacetum coccineum]
MMSKGAIYRGEVKRGKGAGLGKTGFGLCEFLAGKSVVVVKGCYSVASKPGVYLNVWRIGTTSPCLCPAHFVVIKRFDEIKEMSEMSVANDTSGLVPQRQKASDYDNPDPAPELQNVSPLADTTIQSQQELDLLFGPLYDEFFNDGTSRVNKSSSPTNNSIKKDTLLSMHIQPPLPQNINSKQSSC